MKSFKKTIIILVLILVGFVGVVKVIKGASQGSLVTPTTPFGIGGVSNICGILSLNCAEVNSNNSLPVELGYSVTPMTITTLNQELIYSTGGRNTVAFSVTSSGQNTGTFTPYISVDGQLSWEQVHLIRPSTFAGSATAVLSGASPSGTFYIVPVGPATHVKVKATSLTAGSSFVVNMVGAWATTFTLSTTPIILP